MNFFLNRYPKRMADCYLCLASFKIKYNMVITSIINHQVRFLSFTSFLSAIIDSAV